MAGDVEVARETAGILRRLLDAVERGELEPGGAQGVALVRRLEGAAVALEVVGAQKPGRGRRRQGPA